MNLSITYDVVLDIRSGDRPLPCLARIAAGMEADLLARNQMLAALLFSLAQSCENLFSREPTWFLTVNAAEDPDFPDSILRFAEDCSGYLDPRPELPCTNPPMSRESAETIINRLSKRHGPDRGRYERSALFAYDEGRLPAALHAVCGTYDGKGHYHEMWFEGRGWLPGESPYCRLSISNNEDRDLFRKHLEKPNETLLNPLGPDYRGGWKGTPLRLMGGLPAGEWNRSLVEAIVNRGVPIVFLHHDAPARPIPQPEMDLMIRYADLARAKAILWDQFKQRGLLVERSNILPNWTWIRELEDRLWRRLIWLENNDYRFFILRTFRETANLACHVVELLTSPKAPSKELLPFTVDFMWCGLHAVTLSVDSLAYHGLGFDPWPVSREQLQRMLDFIREKGAVTKHELRRRYKAMNAKVRDQVLVKLESEHLIRVEGNRVESVAFADFLQAITERSGYLKGPLNLLKLVPRPETQEEAGEAGGGQVTA